MTLPFWIGREAYFIFLGPKILSRLIYLDLVFCMFKFKFFSSHLAENLYLWIYLAHNKEELNEKISNEQFSRPCCLPYRNVEQWKCMTYTFVYLYLLLLPKIVFLGPTVKSSGHASLPDLVSTDIDPPGIVCANFQ